MTVHTEDYMENYEAARYIAKLRNVSVHQIEDITVMSRSVEFFCKGDKKYTTISIKKLLKVGL